MAKETCIGILHPVLIDLKDGTRKKYKVRIMGLSLKTIFIPLDGGKLIEVEYKDHDIIRRKLKQGKITILFNELNLDCED